MRGRIFIWMSLLIVSGHAWAQSIVQVNDGIDEKIYTLNDLEYYIDSTNLLTIQDISKADFQ
ncbi:MAG: hypothetical protein O9262_09195, partial [Cyclobacteriaceae bacterium]|nr:hypothetical protein [Cyclobacteriaceae bacterium]